MSSGVGDVVVGSSVAHCVIHGLHFSVLLNDNDNFVSCLLIYVLVCILVRKRHSLETQTSRGQVLS